MSKLLRIDVSPRGEYSVSRKIADAVVAEWKQKNPQGDVVTRDVSKGLAIVDLPWIAGAYTTPDQHTAEHKAALKLSDELIEELLSSTEVLIATPMWNFTLPAALTSYMDQIIRIGKTFSATYEGLAAGRPVSIVMASGSNYAPGAHMEKMNQFEAPIRQMLGFIGITDLVIYGAYDTNGVAQGRTTMDAFLADHTPKAIATLVR
jgi:FMN-dependent NADH-azoreductase